MMKYMKIDDNKNKIITKGYSNNEYLLFFNMS